MDIKAKRIGIFGGTFNPIHAGHLIIAMFALEEKGLDEVLFVPCALPPHKGRGELVSGGDRMRMVELAIASNPRFGCSDIELRRGGKSYSIRTVEDLREVFGRGTRFYFMIGSDSLLDIATWVEIERLSELCEFITVRRPGYPLDGLSAGKLSIGEELFGRLAAGFLDSPRIEISSTRIRERVRSGRSIRYLVPDAVDDYIGEKGLYREGGHGNEAT